VNPVRISLPPPAGVPSFRASTEKTTLGLCWLGFGLGLVESLSSGLLSSGCFSVSLLESWFSDLLSPVCFSVSSLADSGFADVPMISETF
jgi:hypothetical protein